MLRLNISRERDWSSVDLFTVLECDYIIEPRQRQQQQQQQVYVELWPFPAVIEHVLIDQGRRGWFLSDLITSLHWLQEKKRKCSQDLMYFYCGVERPIQCCGVRCIIWVEKEGGCQWEYDWNITAITFRRLLELHRADRGWNVKTALEDSALHWSGGKLHVGKSLWFS